MQVNADKTGLPARSAGSSSARAPGGTFAIGDVIAGQYRLQRELGRGGVAVVYEAVHRWTGRTVAVKVLAPDDDVAAASDLGERLLLEARALGSVRHPGVVEVFDAGITAEGAPYLVLEMLRGRSLEGILAARGKLGIPDSVAVARQLVDALVALHARGIVHRDVKPGNLFVVRDPEGIARAKLFDLGIARLDAMPGRRLTASQSILGTPEYMASEQLTGDDEIDARVDVYAAGTTLFECLTGDVPCPGPFSEILTQSLVDFPHASRLEAAGVPGSLAAVIGKACARRRDERFTTMEEFGRALDGASPRNGHRIGLLEDPQKPRAPQPSAPSPAPAWSTTPPIVPPTEAALFGVARRRHPRAPYSTPVRINTVNGALDGRSEDISVGGMLVIARTSVTALDAVHVRFSLPLEGTVTTVRGSVRWVRDARPGQAGSVRAIGIDFEDLAPDQVESIERYVELMGRIG
ncbi:MAG: serine/threonine-protein kinase [Deltaproteobacteria bacterium]